MYKSHKYNGCKSSVGSYFKDLCSKYKTMRQIIILACLMVCCVAAPTSQQTSTAAKEHDLPLERPSPINPDVPSDPKPAEKITKITDPKEIVKHKREAEDNPYDHITRFAPTALPVRQAERLNKHSQESTEQSLEADSTHHRQKREKEQNRETKKSANVSASTPVSPLKAHPEPVPARDLPKSRQRRQVDPHLIGASTVPVAPLLYIEEKNKSNEEEVQHETNSEDPLASEISDHTETYESKSTDVATPVKRDIPVPLVPKYHHPEESPKSGEKAEKGEKNEQQKHASEEDSKSKESSESNESHEDSKEKKPVIQSQNLPIDQHQEPHIPVQASHTTVNKEELEEHTTPVSEQTKPADVQNVTSAIEHINEPLVEQLAGVVPTEVIAYETPASKEIVIIKHPIPVAELFSNHKPT
ncbi:neurofilament heavy polypeptide isoform X1 [Bactrocera oleae]|uniref:neurofilament heavy polypeptide isoform X1 n=2 Tax=Bactrocera oleae TaxID=104688 RepID=UPI00387E6411